jgi:outer membrane biosynthesis protein TonB
VRGLRQRAVALPIGRVGAAGTLALHLAVALTFVAAGGSPARPRAPIAYRVSLIAAPPPAAAPAARTDAAAPPAVAPPAPPRPAAPTRDAVPLQAAPRPASARPAPATPAPATSAATAPAATRPASPVAAASGIGPAGSTTAGTDAATIRTEGVEFPFPGYLRNLVSQVYQRWRPPPSQAALVAEVLFFLHRDGSVTGLQFIRRSGAFGFDLEVQGAIESAARAHAFGSLPDGYGSDVLPVSFFFNPRGR